MPELSSLNFILFFSNYFTDVTLVGFLDYKTGEVYVEEHKRYDAEVFRDFLNHVLEHYPEGKIVMILDNAKIHHAKLLNDLLDANPRLHLEFLPP